MQIKIDIQYYYITLADEIHPNVESQANELKVIVNQLYPSAKVDVTFLGADDLMNLYNSDSEVCVNLEFAENPIAMGKNTEYIALVNLATCFRFITDENNKLRSSFFEANVRDYQGNNSVNSCIAESLSNSLLQVLKYRRKCIVQKKEMYILALMWYTIYYCIRASKKENIRKEVLIWEKT